MLSWPEVMNAPDFERSKFKAKLPISCSFANCGLNENSSRPSSQWYEYIYCPGRKMNMIYITAFVTKSQKVGEMGKLGDGH